jgi:hypothetical protein
MQATRIDGRENRNRRREEPMTDQKPAKRAERLPGRTPVRLNFGRDNLPTLLLVAVVTFGLTFVGSLVNGWMADAKRVSELKHRIALELVPNQNILRWTLRVSQAKGNSVWNNMNCDPNRIGMMSYDVTTPRFQWEVYELSRPDVHLLGVEDMQIVDEYYSNLKALEAERKRLQTFYDKKMQEWIIKQYYDSGYLPICARTYDIGKYLMDKFARLAIADDPLNDGPDSAQKP